MSWPLGVIPPAEELEGAGFEQGLEIGAPIRRDRRKRARPAMACELEEAKDGEVKELRAFPFRVRRCDLGHWTDD